VSFIMLLLCECVCCFVIKCSVYGNVWERVCVYLFNNIIFNFINIFLLYLFLIFYLPPTMKVHLLAQISKPSLFKLHLLLTWSMY